MVTPYSLTDFRRTFINKAGQDYKSFYYKSGIIILREEHVNTRYIGDTPL
jgi:hypothetical protein